MVDFPRLIERRVWRLVLALAIGYVVAVLALFPKWTVDDAFITYRYAENLAFHGQLTWNVGEDPIEGYTGVALPAMLACAVRLGVDADVASELVGIGSFLGGGLFLLALIRLLGGRASIAVGVVTLYYTAPLYATHALSGLETMLFTMAILASLCALAWCLVPNENRAWRECVFLATLLGAALVRPEGLVLAALSTLSLGIAMLRSERRHFFAFTVRTLLLLALPLVAYFLWRRGYYGHWLPNTYYAKWTRRVSWDSIESLGKFVALYTALPFLAGVTLFCVSSARRERVPAPASSWTYLAPVGVGVAFLGVCAVQYARSYLVMNYSYRFYAPFLPVLLAAAAVFLERGLRGDASARVGRVATAAVLAAQVAVNVALLPREIAFASGTKQLLEDEHMPAAYFLRDNVPAEEWIVVVVDAGAIPYFSQLKTIDFGGLNDEFLSRRFRDKLPPDRVIDYFFARNPGAAVFTSKNPDSVEGPEPLPITADPRFANYVLARAFGSERWPNYYELVYLRRDLWRQ